MMCSSKNLTEINLSGKKVRDDDHVGNTSILVETHYRFLLELLYAMNKNFAKKKLSCKILKILGRYRLNKYFSEMAKGKIVQFFRLFIVILKLVNLINNFMNSKQKI